MQIFHPVIINTLSLKQNIWDGILPEVVLLYWFLTMYKIQPNMSADSRKQKYQPQCL